MSDAALKQATAMALECSIVLDEMCRLLAIAQPDIARAIADRLNSISQTLLASAMPDDALRAVYEMTAEMLNERQIKLLPPQP